MQMIDDTAIGITDPHYEAGDNSRWLSIRQWEFKNELTDYELLIC